MDINNLYKIESYYKTKYLDTVKLIQIGKELITLYC